MSYAFRTNLFVLFMILWQLALSFVWGNIVTAFSITIEWQMILTQFLIFVVPIVLFFIITKENPKNILQIKPLSIQNIVFIIVISVFIQPVMSFLAAVSLLFFTNSVTVVMAEFNAIPLPIYLIAMAVIPSICEELFFRGVTLSGYRNVYLVKAVVMNGLLFGMMHMDGQQFLYAFVMGMVFCYLVYKTKSIFASILSHFVINGSQVVLARISLHYLETNQIEQNLSAPSLPDIISAIVASLSMILFTMPILLLCFWLFHKHNSKKTEYDLVVTEEVLDYSPSQQFEEKIFNLPFYIILTIYIIIVIVLPTLITILQ